MLPINKPSAIQDSASDLEFLREAITKPTEENKAVKQLAIHIDKVWQQNQKDNKSVRLEMIKLLKRVRGEYDQEKLSAIRAFKGSEAYIRVSENKARAAESWIKDIYRGDQDLPWELEPTENPDLPDETLAQIKMQTQQKVSQFEQQLLQTQETIDTSQVARLMQDYYEEQLDKAINDMKAEAKERCKRAEKEIRDQNQEGGWNTAFKDFLYYFVRLKYGVIKGPILTKKKKQVWQATETGYELTTIDTLVNDVYCVSPFNFFPQKKMKTINDGDVIEIHELTRQSISDLIGVPGYSETEIREVLDEYENGKLKAKWFSIEDETAVKQVTLDKIQKLHTTPITQNTTSTQSDTIYAQEFYGTVSGKLLVDWGIEENLDPHIQYQANCWKIGNHVIKAVINPDSLGRKPYHISSWAKNPEWIIGEGLIEFASPIEDAINAITRALINNIAIASGPMAEIDKDRVDNKLPIYPWRQIESTSMQMKNDGPAVVYYQPQMHAESLINAWQFFSRVLDEMTVPAYAQGASQSGVTAGTATVFTQLLAAASRSIKSVVANIDDDIITPYIQMCYDYNMKFSEDNSIRGDARAIAKGVNGLLAREQQSHQKIELLQMISNPAYMEILGQKNIGSLLSQIIKGQDIQLPDIDRLDGSETAETQLQQILMAQAGLLDVNQLNGQASNGGGAVQKQQGVNPDGSKAGVINA